LLDSLLQERQPADLAMSDSILFARDPVWSQTTRSGFRQQVFVMYHATRTVENVEKILNEGFKVATMQPHLILGGGLYVSRDISKSQAYGPVIFKLLVYPGKTKTITERGDPMMLTWNKEFSSAWIPPRNAVTPSQKEETCVKASLQVRILGIAQGHELLDYNVRARIENLAGTGDSLSKRDNHILNRMLEELGIVYSTMVNMTHHLFLDGRYGTDVKLTDLRTEQCGRVTEHQQWSRTWDNCLENKATGLVLTLAGDALVMEEVNPQIDRRQKWKLDNSRKFLHKASNRILVAGESTGRGLERFTMVQPYGFPSGRDDWRLHCMNELRDSDDFVHFTPWANMISWD